jgi:drug/metabolite transporter (DMT)-like permease
VRLVLAFAAVYLIWGSTYVAIKFAIETMPPFLMAGVRFTIAGAILTGWFLLRRTTPWPPLREWRSAFIVGGLLLLGGNGLICWAELTVPSGVAALLVATVPLWMAVLDWLFFRGPRPTVRMTLGIVIGLLGVLVLVNPSTLLDEPIAPLGGAAILLACVSWAVGSLYGRRAPLPRAVLLATGMEMLCGGLLLVAAALLRGEGGSVNLAAISVKSLLAFAYLIVFGALVGYVAYIWLLNHVSAAAVSTYAYVNPVVAVVLGWALAEEELGPRAERHGGSEAAR